MSIGARISAKDDIGENAIMKAAREGHLPIMKFLVYTALSSAPKKLGAAAADASASEMEKKRIIDAKDDEGVTALMKGSDRICLFRCRIRGVPVAA